MGIFGGPWGCDCLSVVYSPGLNTQVMSVSVIKSLGVVCVFTWFVPTEEGCEWVECPLPLLCGESVEYMCYLEPGGGQQLYLTNYRLLATQQTGFYCVSPSLLL